MVAAFNSESPAAFNSESPAGFVGIRIHPKPIREWAKWTIKELDRRGLRRQRWEPLQNAVAVHPVDARSADDGLAVG
jgi:hypothetical protein